MRRLGDLEAAVMDRLWAQEGAVSVRQVLEDLNQDRALAYTTVMTVLDNLHRKGMVTRTQSGRAYLYVPARTREEHAAELIAGVLEEAPDRTVPLLRFVQSLTAEEVHRLRTALDAAVAPGRVRRRRGAGGDASRPEAPAVDGTVPTGGTRSRGRDR